MESTIVHSVSSIRTTCSGQFVFCQHEVCRPSTSGQSALHRPISLHKGKHRWHGEWRDPLEASWRARPHNWQLAQWRRPRRHAKNGNKNRLTPHAVCSLPVVAIERASSLFTIATVLVMPCYASMIFAPRSALTRKLMNSSVPYFILGVIYIYLLTLSWTPQTFPSMFSSKYWLPELSGMARMFQSTLTVASAWIHLLAVDLFAARNVFLDGLAQRVETRHSLILCLLFAPIGIFSHIVTKNMVGWWRRRGKCDPEEPDKPRLMQLLA